MKASLTQIFSGLAGILILAAVAGCGDPASTSATAPEMKSTVAGNDAFALDLYQALKDQPGNLVFSPYGISAGSAMTYAGARGQTEREMAKVLHFTQSPGQLHATFNSLATRMDKVQRWNRITLTTANSLWCQEDAQFLPTFLNEVRQSYLADARLVDFKRPEAARTDINSWIAQKTKQKIDGAIGPGQLTPDTRLVLCSAIYFKGKWEHPFDDKNTKPCPFYLSPEQTVAVPMMIRRKAEFKAAWTNDLSLLELPYAGKDLSMMILLPDAVDGLPDLERQLNVENLSRWIALLTQSPKRELAVLLPRFKTTQGIDLKTALSALGMPTLFNKSDADLSGMNGARDLYISDAVHKAFIEVNESGTEAAAATWFAPTTKSMTSSFRADHPFLFLIREHQTGSILFLGRIVDPTK